MSKLKRIGRKFLSVVKVLIDNIEGLFVSLMVLFLSSLACLVIIDFSDFIKSQKSQDGGSKDHFYTSNNLRVLPVSCGYDFSLSSTPIYIVCQFKVLNQGENTPNLSLLVKKYGIKRAEIKEAEQLAYNFVEDAYEFSIQNCKAPQRIDTQSFMGDYPTLLNCNIVNEFGKSLEDELKHLMPNVYKGESNNEKQ